MIERLKIIEERYNFLDSELMKPEVYNDFKKMKELSKEKTSLESTVEAYHTYSQILEDIEAAKEMLHDQEMADFAKDELEKLTKQKEEIENKINNFDKVIKNTDDKTNLNIIIKEELKILEKFLNKTN